MKTWKHLTFMAIVAIIALVFVFTTCDSGGGSSKPTPTPKPPALPQKPAFVDMFYNYEGSLDSAMLTRVEEAYDAIWVTNPALITRLKNAVNLKGSPIGVSMLQGQYDITFVSVSGRIRIGIDIESVDFSAAFEAAIKAAADYYLEE